MNISDEAIRKAAILVAALDMAAADALLEGMDDALAARVRASCMELDEVDAGEQQRVIQQFMGRDQPATRNPTAIVVTPTLDELNLSSATPLAAYLTAAENARSSPDDERALGVLETATGEQLAAALRHEHPQTIAVVLANIAPSAAAATLAQLSAAQQADVAHRIADLRQVDGEALRELQTGVRESLAARFGHSDAHQSGLDALRRIWNEATASDKSALERNLRGRNAQLLAELGAMNYETQTEVPLQVPAAPPDQTSPADVPQKRPVSPAVPFAALAELDSASLGRVLQLAEGRTLLLALAGASPALVHHVYRLLPRREALLLRRQIEQQGPIALRDVAEAQRRLAMLASKLAAEDELEISSTLRLAVGA